MVMLVVYPLAPFYHKTVLEFPVIQVLKRRVSKRNGRQDRQEAVAEYAGQISTECGLTKSARFGRGSLLSHFMATSNNLPQVTYGASPELQL